MGIIEMVSHPSYRCLFQDNSKGPKAFVKYIAKLYKKYEQKKHFRIIVS